MLLLLICVGLVLAISFLCSLTEAVLLSLSTADIAAVSVGSPRAAETMRRLKENIQKPIAAILIVNNLVNIIGASLAGALFAGVFGSRWIGVFSFLLALAIIQWSEYLPKTIGVLYKRPLAVVLARPLAGVTRALAPLVSLLELVSLPFRGRRGARRRPDTLGDIVLLAQSASLNKLITREQEAIVARSLRLSTAAVRDIMVARDEIKFLAAEMSLADALVEAHIHHHTRYPLITGGDLDRVLGFVNVKDIVGSLHLNPADPSLRGIVRPLPEVPNHQPVTALLRMLTRSYQHMALVRDQRGRTVGLVTIEDVVEAILGDLEDEYDRLPEHVQRLSLGRYLVGGGVPLAVLRAQTGLEVPSEPLGLHDWLVRQIPRVPVIEQRIRSGEVLFTVRKLRRSRIYEVIVEQAAPSAGGQPPARDAGVPA